MNAITLIQPIRINPEPYRVQPEDSALFGNDPWIAQALSDADCDNRNAVKGTISMLTADLNNARRLHEAVHDQQIVGQRFAAFARRICNLGRSVAFELMKLAAFHDQVLDWVEAEARRLGVHYRAPSWRACLARFTSAARAARATPAASKRHIDVLAVAAETAKLHAELATVTAERDAALLECKRLEALLAAPVEALAAQGPIRSQRPETVARRQRRADREAGVVKVRSKRSPEEQREATKLSQRASRARKAAEHAGKIPRTPAQEKSMRKQMEKRRLQTAARRASHA